MKTKRKIALSVFVAILLTSLWSASGTLDSIDAGMRARVAHQLLTEKRLLVESAGDSKKSSTFRDQNGTYSSTFGLGQSVFFLPFDAVANLITPRISSETKQRERIHGFVLSVPVFWVVLSLNFWLCLKLSAKLGTDKLNAYLISFVATFGSSFWQMAKQGQEEVQLSILLLCSLYGFLCWNRDGANKYVWLSVISAASTLIFRPTALPILVGVTAIYAYELFFRKKTAQSKNLSYLPTVVTFATVYLGAVAIVCSYNFFKTGNPLKFGYALSGWFTANWLNGIIQPIFGLDKGIVWTNLWLLPCLISPFLAWKYLKHELKILLILSLCLFASSVATYSKCCWAGDFTYGARYQVHLVPLLCLTLGTATITYIKICFPRKLHKTRYKLLSLLFGLIFFVLQIPSVAFIHTLEIYQALASNTAAKNGSTTGKLGQIQLRYANFSSKLATGKTVKFKVFNRSVLPPHALEDASRWNFWPWLSEKRLNSNVVNLMKAVWNLIVVVSIVSWGYVFWVFFKL